MEDSLHERCNHDQRRAENCDDEDADHKEGDQWCLSDWLAEAHSSLVGSPARVAAYAEESSETDRGQRQNEMPASDSEAKLLSDQDAGADQGQPGTCPGQEGSLVSEGEPRVRRVAHVIQV